MGGMTALIARPSDENEMSAGTVRICRWCQAHLPQTSDQLFALVRMRRRHTEKPLQVAFSVADPDTKSECRAHLASYTAHSALGKTLQEQDRHGMQVLVHKGYKYPASTCHDAAGISTTMAYTGEKRADGVIPALRITVSRPADHLGLDMVCPRR